MKTIYFRVGIDTSKEIGYQYEHKAKKLMFVNVNYIGTVCIIMKYNTPDGIEQTDVYDLTSENDGYSIPVGYPLTENYGVVEAQLVATTYNSNGTLTYSELSGVFQLIINKSLKGDSAEYPIDPVVPKETIEQILNGKAENIEKNILKKLLVVKEQPKDVYITTGQEMTMSYIVVGLGVTYQWQLYSDVSGWNNCGCNEYYLTRTNTPSRWNGYMFRCIAKDCLGNESISSVATLHIVPILINSQPQNVECSIYDEVEFKVVASGNGLSYQWQFSNNGGNTWQNTNITGYNTNTLSVTMNSTIINYLWRCKITDSQGNELTTNIASATEN